MVNEEQWQMFDTNVVSDFRNGRPGIVKRYLAVPPKLRCVAVLTVEEQMSGWYTRLRKAKTDEEEIAVYAQLSKTARFYGEIRILEYNEAALERYRALTALKLGVKKPDLRIAAIALAHNAAVVTRNVPDFVDIPNLVVADWNDDAASA